MAVSGTTDFNLNSREIITQALRLIRVCPAGEPPDSDDAADAAVALNLMLKTWGTNEHLSLVTFGGPLTLVGALNFYSVPLARRMIDVQRVYTPGSTSTPLTEMSRQEWDALPNKTNTGIPVQYYFDPQRDTRRLYLWPTPSVADALTVTLRYTYQRVIDNIDSLDNDLDVPQEWLQAITYGLADLLQDYHNVDFPKITARAGFLFKALQAQDQEMAPIFFSPQQSY